MNTLEEHLVNTHTTIWDTVASTLSYLFSGSWNNPKQEKELSPYRKRMQNLQPTDITYFWIYKSKKNINQSKPMIDDCFNSNLWHLSKGPEKETQGRYSLLKKVTIDKDFKTQENIANSAIQIKQKGEKLYISTSSDIVQISVVRYQANSYLPKSTIIYNHNFRRSFTEQGRRYQIAQQKYQQELEQKTKPRKKRHKKGKELVQLGDITFGKGRYSRNVLCLANNKFLQSYEQQTTNEHEEFNYSCKGRVHFEFKTRSGETYYMQFRKPEQKKPNGIIGKMIDTQLIDMNRLNRKKRYNTQMRNIEIS